jgi:hypothetical protein
MGSHSATAPCALDRDSLDFIDDISIAQTDQTGSYFW